MVKIPIPVPRLCLSFEFDIETSEHPSTDQHDAAIKKAARVLDDFIGFSKHGVTADAFSAKAIDGDTLDPDRQLTLAVAHNSPFDPNFHVAIGGPAIRYEFIYSDKRDSSHPCSKLFMRIVTSFGKPNETIDGVLATRVGLTAIEILQGNEVNPTIFPQYPPLKIGMRHIGNFFNHIILHGILAIPLGYVSMYLQIILERLGAKDMPDVTRVNDVVSMLRFHSTKQGSEPASYQLYRSDTKGAYKVFLNIVEKWKNSLGLDGYFYLVNFSPMAAPAITYNIHDIYDIKARYRGAFAPAGPPPGEDIWPVANFTFANLMVANNYGVHKHNFAVKPVSFIWDWLHVRNTINLAACITINGVFMCCFRGLASSFQSLEIPDDLFPTPVTKAASNISWKATMKP
jgi:hypothetical protein